MDRNKNTSRAVKRTSQGEGKIDLSLFKHIGQDVIIEPSVLIFHPENIEIGHNVYIGHYTILKGYYINQMIIGNGTWIGQQCFFHSAGGIRIGDNVGIGPGVKILTSFHSEGGINRPIIHSKIEFATVTIENNCDIGVGSIILPGVKIGMGVQIGAGAVITKDLPDYSVAAGVPAKILRMRN